MSRSISRRDLVARTGLGVAALGSGLLGPPLSARAQGATPVKTGTLFGGWAHLGNDTLLEMGFDKKHGFQVTNHQTYNVLATYYADFAKGSRFLPGGGSADLTGCASSATRP